MPAGWWSRPNRARPRPTRWPTRGWASATSPAWRSRRASPWRRDGSMSGALRERRPTVEKDVPILVQIAGDEIVGTRGEHDEAAVTRDRGRVLARIIALLPARADAHP